MCLHAFARCFPGYYLLQHCILLSILKCSGVLKAHRFVIVVFEILM